MAFQPAPNVAEFNINQRLYGELVQNNIYAIRNPDWDAATLSNAVAALASWFEDVVLPSRAQDLELFSVEARVLTTENAPTVTFPLVPTPNGGVVGQSLPGSCALCVSFRTGLSGRSARGRNYCAGIPEAASNANLVDESFANAQQAAYALLPTLFSQFGAIHVVLSRFANGEPRATGFAFAISSYIVVDRVIDSQRRRLPGRGQ